MVGQNHLGAVADKQMAVHHDSSFAQSPNLFEKSHGIEHYAVADYTAAVFPQHSAGHELQYKFLTVDDDGMASIVAAGIARHDREILREHVNNFALALIAPLRSDDDRGFPLLQDQLRGTGQRGYFPAGPGRFCRAAHALLAVADYLSSNYWDIRRSRVYLL